ARARPEGARPPVLDGARGHGRARLPGPRLGDEPLPRRPQPGDRRLDQGAAGAVDGGDPPARDDGPPRCRALLTAPSRRRRSPAPRPSRTTTRPTPGTGRRRPRPPARRTDPGERGRRSTGTTPDRRGPLRSWG